MQINTTQTHQPNPAVNPAPAAVEAVNPPVQQVTPLPNAPAIPAAVPSAARQAQNALIRQAQDTSRSIADRVNTVVHISDKKTQIAILEGMYHETTGQKESMRDKKRVLDTLLCIDSGTYTTLLRDFNARASGANFI